MHPRRDALTPAFLPQSPILHHPQHPASVEDQVSFYVLPDSVFPCPCCAAAFKEHWALGGKPHSAPNMVKIQPRKLADVRGALVRKPTANKKAMKGIAQKARPCKRHGRGSVLSRGSWLFLAG